MTALLVWAFLAEIQSIYTAELNHTASDVQQIKLEDVPSGDYMMDDLHKHLTLTIAGGNDVTATLTKKPLLFNLGFQMEQCDKNGCTREPLDDFMTTKLSSCTFTGSMDQDPFSVVSVSNCGDMLNLGVVSNIIHLQSTTYKQKNGLVTNNEVAFQERQPKKDVLVKLAKSLQEGLIRGDTFIGKNNIVYQYIREPGKDGTEECCQFKKRECVPTDDGQLYCSALNSARRCGKDCDRMKRMVTSNAKKNVENILRLTGNDQLTPGPAGVSTLPPTSVTLEPLVESIQPPLGSELLTNEPTPSTIGLTESPPSLAMEVPSSMTSDISTLPAYLTSTTAPESSTFSTEGATPPSTSAPAMEDTYEDNYESAEEVEDVDTSADEKSKTVNEIVLDELVKVLKDTKGQSELRPPPENSIFRSKSIKKVCVGECIEKHPNPKTEMYQERTIELGICTDRFLWDKMKAQVNKDDSEVKMRMVEMVHSLMISTETHFLHKSISANGGFKLAINGLSIWKDDSDPLVAEVHNAVDQEATLDAFSKYAKKKNNPYDGYQESYDMMILLSGAHDKFGLPQGSDSGLSFVGAVCKVECTMVLSVTLEDMTHLSNSGALLAHEMGHSLGAYHDGEYGRDRKFQNCPQGKYIMTPAQQGVITEWSSCSRTQIDEEFDRREKEHPEYGNCFNT